MHKTSLFQKKSLFDTGSGENDRAGQNCLLKTLEEPPEYAVIILATANYESLLETIRSRSVRINFAKNTFDEVKRFIVSRAGGDFEQADL